MIELNGKGNFLAKEAAINAVLAGPGGLQALGGVMLQPIVKDLLHEGRMRQVYTTYKLDLGEEALFDADVAVKAAAIAPSGIADTMEVKSDRVRCNTAPISIVLSIRWNESNYRKFDIINRAQERAKSAVQTEEDLQGFALIDYSCQQHYNTGTSGFAPMTGIGANSEAKVSLQDLIKASATMANNRVDARKIVANPMRASDLVSLYQDQYSGIKFVPETAEKNLKAGQVGEILGLKVLSVPKGEGLTEKDSNGIEKILNQDIIADDKMYVLSSPEKVGIFAVRTDLSVETQKMVGQMADLIGLWEDVGLLVRYCNGAYGLKA